MDTDDATARILDGTAWTDFCRTLERAGQQILRADAPGDAFTRAEGFRYLTRLVRGGLESCLELADADFPVFYSLSHTTLKIGADNPDNLYLNARVDGRRVYRITGTRGTVHYLGFATKAGGYDTTGSMPPTGFLDTRTLAVGDDGTLAIVVAATPHPGNWLPMTDATRMLIVRQTFQDRATETPAALQIARIDADAKPAPLAPVDLEARLRQAAGFVEGTARLFADWAAGFAAHPNTLPPQDQARYQAAGGDPSIHYLHGYWALGEDDALVVELPRIPTCDAWNFQLNNHWMESLDYRYHRVHVNAHTAAVRPDGGVTIVVAHRDPGVPNWIETAGHRLGTMCFRWIGAREIVLPTTRVVPLAKVGS